MHWKKVLNLPVAVPGENSEIIPKGARLQGFPCCNLSLLQPRQQRGVVLSYPLLWCQCWARVPLASPADQQNTLPRQQTAWMWDMEHCAASFQSVRESPESPFGLQPLVARPQLRHGLSLPALPMHTRKGEGGIYSTLLPQPLRFYSFKVSSHTKQSLRIVQWWGTQGSKARSAQPHKAPV